MAVGKRIYLKRHMPDKEVMMQFKTIPASNTCDVMERNAAMNPRIRLILKSGNFGQEDFFGRALAMTEKRGED